MYCSHCGSKMESADTVCTTVNYEVMANIDHSLKYIELAERFITAFECFVGAYERENDEYTKANNIYAQHVANDIANSKRF